AVWRSPGWSGWDKHAGESHAPNWSGGTERYAIRRCAVRRGRCRRAPLADYCQTREWLRGTVLALVWLEGQLGAEKARTGQGLYSAEALEGSRGGGTGAGPGCVPPPYGRLRQAQADRSRDGQRGTPAPGGRSLGACPSSVFATNGSLARGERRVRIG